MLQERNLRFVDAPYGLMRQQLFERLFAAPHPLHGGVAGIPSELQQAKAADVRAFVGSYLAPANAVLVVAGRFDPAQATAMIEDGLGRLAGGGNAQRPTARRACGCGPRRKRAAARACSSCT